MENKIPIELTDDIVATLEAVGSKYVLSDGRTYYQHPNFLYTRDPMSNKWYIIPGPDEDTKDLYAKLLEHSKEVQDITSEKVIKIWKP